MFSTRSDPVKTAWSPEPMHASEVTPEAAARANELYWKSDRSVNQIAEDLDLSKGTLYAVLAPEATGLGCPLCGDEVVYANRTAKDRDALDCPTCDWDGSSEEAGGYSAPIHEDSPVPAINEADALESVPTRPPLNPRMSTVAGGALLGAAVGLALVMWARRR